MTSARIPFSSFASSFDKREKSYSDSVFKHEISRLRSPSTYLKFSKMENLLIWVPRSANIAVGPADPAVKRMTND